VLDRAERNEINGGAKPKDELAGCAVEEDPLREPVDAREVGAQGSLRLQRSALLAIEFHRQSDGVPLSRGAAPDRETSASILGYRVRLLHQAPPPEPSDEESSRRLPPESRRLPGRAGTTTAAPHRIGSPKCLPSRSPPGGSE